MPAFRVPKARRMSKTTDTLSNLESPQRRRQERWGAIGERIGWTLMGGTLLLAILGLLGPGLFGSRTAANADGSLVVHYNAVERCSAPSQLRVSVKPLTRGDAIRIRISRAFTDNVKMEAISPEPIEMEADDVSLAYVFRLSDLSQSSCVIVFRYEYDRFGSLEYEVGLNGGSGAVVSQRVMP